MDIKNLQQKNRELEQRIAYLENIINLLPGHIYWQDTNSKFLGCNLEQAKSVGLVNSNQIIGTTPYDHLAENEAAQIVKNNAAIMSSGIPQYKEEVSTYTDGKKKYFLSHKIPLLDESLKINGILGVSLDITKQKELEKEIKKAKQIAEETLQGIIAVVPGNVYWKDINGNYLGCNDEFAKLLKLNNRKDIIHKSDYDFLEKSLADAIDASDQEIICSGIEKSIEELGIDAQGNQAFYLTKKSPLADRDGNIIGLAGVSIDITKRKEMELALIDAKEKADIANKAKSDFLTNMSHDIRTPLNGILGFSQILESRETDPVKKELLGIVHQSSQKLVNLLNEIIEITNIETYGLNLHSTQFNLKLLLTDIVDLVLAETQSKNIYLNVEIAEDVPSSILGDKLRTHRIILNLVGNAIKFTHKGGVSIKAAVDKVEQDNISIKISIKDSGIGIPTEKLSIIFEKFTRLTLSDQSPYKGSGLGLYIVKKFIDDLNGRIEATSQVENGTEFTCYIPYKLNKCD